MKLIISLFVCIMYQLVMWNIEGVDIDVVKERDKKEKGMHYKGKGNHNERGRYSNKGEKRNHDEGKGKYNERSVDINVVKERDKERNGMHNEGKGNHNEIGVDINVIKERGNETNGMDNDRKGNHNERVGDGLKFVWQSVNYLGFKRSKLVFKSINGSIVNHCCDLCLRMFPETTLYEFKKKARYKDLDPLCRCFETKPYTTPDTELFDGWSVGNCASRTLQPSTTVSVTPTTVPATITVPAHMVSTHTSISVPITVLAMTTIPISTAVQATTTVPTPTTVPASITVPTHMVSTPTSISAPITVSAMTTIPISTTVQATTTIPIPTTVPVTTPISAPTTVPVPTTVSATTIIPTPTILPATITVPTPTTIPATTMISTPKTVPVPTAVPALLNERKMYDYLVDEMSDYKSDLLQKGKGMSRPATSETPGYKKRRGHHSRKKGHNKN